MEANALRMFGAAVVAAGQRIDRRRSAWSRRDARPGALAPGGCAQQCASGRIAAHAADRRSSSEPPLFEPRRRDRPKIADLSVRLPASGFDVRVRCDALAARQQRHPRVLPPSWIAVDDQSRSPGFCVTSTSSRPIPTRTWGPYVSWSVLQALAEGAVVVADPAWESLLGDAGVYAAPGDVEVVLKELATNPEQLDEQRDRGYAICRDRASSAALTSLVGTLLAGREDGR